MPRPALLLLFAILPQQVPTVTLPAPNGRSADGFTNIFAVHELADGRVLMTDNLDRAIRIVDLRSGSVEELGRTGSGPREYESVTSIVPGNGDTVRVADNRLRRFVIVVDGALVGTEVYPSILRAQSNFSAPLTDAFGRIYFDQSQIDMTASGFRERNGHVVRWTPGTTRLDTVMTIPVTSHAPRANAGYNPFVFRSAWGVARDGAVVLVHAEPYRVEWIRDGRKTIGPVIDYAPVRIDAAERDAERTAFMQRGVGGIRFRGGERPPPTREVRSRIPDDVFPPFKPPFTERRVLVSPAREAWIPRAAPWDADSTVIDVVGRDGTLRRHVRVPANTRVVGFGARSIYLAVSDEYDLQRLVRVPVR